MDGQDAGGVCLRALRGGDAIDPCVADGEIVVPVMTDDDAELKRLRWKCRRGMRELDTLFGRYLDRAWRAAGIEERGVFLRLLEVEDDKLWLWFLGHETPADEALRALVERIRALPP